LIKNAQPFGKKCPKTAGGLTHMYSDDIHTQHCSI